MLCYTGIQGLNYPELPSRGILGNKEIILFDCTCELCGYEWVGLLDELMSICSVSDNFYTYFLNKKLSANNFGAKFEASGDPGWCHTGIQNHAVEVSTPAHNEQNCVVFGSHRKPPIFRVSDWYLCHMHNVRVGSFI